MTSYVPILILGAMAVGMAAFIILFSHILGLPRPNPRKSSVYECGMPPIGSTRERFSVKFYLVCMVFILFDVDAAFLYPWALIFRELGVAGLLSMLAFVGFLGGGFAYAWKMGTFDW